MENSISRYTIPYPVLFLYCWAIHEGISLTCELEGLITLGRVHFRTRFWSVNLPFVVSSLLLLIRNCWHRVRSIESSHLTDAVGPFFYCDQKSSPREDAGEKPCFLLLQVFYEHRIKDMGLVGSNWKHLFNVLHSTNFKCGRISTT